MLLNKEILTPELCDEIIEILSRQTLKVMLEKFLTPKYLDEKGIDHSYIKYIATKSGSFGGDEQDNMINCRNDGGIISTSVGNYIISIFIYDFKDHYFYNDNPAIILGSKINKLIFESFEHNKGTIK